jgi:hypothetical protein
MQFALDDAKGAANSASTHAAAATWRRFWRNSSGQPRFAYTGYTPFSSGRASAFLHLLLPAHLPRTKEDHQRLVCPELCRLDIRRPCIRLSSLNSARSRRTFGRIQILMIGDRERPRKSRNDQTDTAKHGNHFKNIDIGRDRRNRIREDFCNCSHGGSLGWLIAPLI